MKKWAILILVILGGLLLALQYLMNKKAGTGSSAPNPQVNSDGVPLPAGATNYQANIPYSRTTDNRFDPTQLNIPMISTTYKGACEGGSLTDMLGTHNKYWGRLAKNNPFSVNDTKRMYAFVGDYVACVSVARDNATLCDTLPSEPPQKGGPKPGAARSGSGRPAPQDRGTIRERSQGGLRFNCRKRVNPILFIAYMAGKSKSSDSCGAILSGWKPPTLAKISATDFCAAAEKGMDAVTEYMQKTMVKKKKDSKKPARPGARFASTESACGGNKECIASTKLYNAIKSGNAAQCPPAERHNQHEQPGGRQNSLPAPPERASGNKNSPDVMCTAAITGSAMSCEPIVKAMSGFYCAAVVKTKKKGGGYMGMTKEEVEAAVAQKKSEADETERRRKQAQKDETEINKKVKKLLGKE